MDATVDELAGVVDLFGGLTRAELERALTEAAFRADGRTVDERAVEATIERALESFALVEYHPDDDDKALLVAGPTAFPTVPDYAEDVPHILAVTPRRLDREALGAAAADRFDTAVEAARSDGDADRLNRLVDVSYDLEAWAPVDLSEERGRLLEGLDE